MTNAPLACWMKIWAFGSVWTGRKTVNEYALLLEKLLAGPLAVLHPGDAAVDADPHLARRGREPQRRRWHRPHQNRLRPASTSVRT